LFKSPELIRLATICEIFLGVDAHVESCKATMEALIEWRDQIYEDEAEKSDPTTPPAFGGYNLPSGATYGIIDELREIVENWKTRPGYTLAIGEDLRIVGNEVTPISGSIAPTLSVETKTNYVVKLSGKMQSMNAVRIEYQRKGAENFSLVGVLTSLPGELAITPQTPNEPEAGHIRAVYIKKNEPFGDYSPDYPVTVSK
jgi:hypothetical protein